LARCPNVIAKLGGLAMPDNGFGWHLADRPPTSDEIVEAHQDYFLHTIDCFGPDRCMFESNFPVDRLSVSYRVLFNAFKKMVPTSTMGNARRCSPARRHGPIGSDWGSAPVGPPPHAAYGSSRNRWIVPSAERAPSASRI